MPSVLIKSAPYCLLGVLLSSSLCFAHSETPASTQAETHAQFISESEVELPQGYRSWTHVGTFYTPPGSVTILDGSTIEGGQFSNTYIEPSALAAYKATGQWPDGTQIVKEFSESSLQDGECDKATGVCKTDHGRGVFQHHYFGMGYMVKDKVRFADAPGNWGYFGFGPAAGDDYPKTAVVRAQEQCSACHVINRAHLDYVFSDLHLGTE